MNKLNQSLILKVVSVLMAAQVVYFSGTDFASAQSTQRFALDYQILGEANDVEASAYTGRFSHRFFLDKEGVNLLTVGLAASQVEIIDSSLTGADRKRELRAIVPELNLLKVLNEQYSLAVTLRPGFFGNLEGSLSDEFRLEGGVVLTKFINENLTLGLGLGRGTNFGRDLVVPLLQFLYFATDKIVLRGLLPVRASAWYIPSQKWEFGLLYKLQGSMYHIDETNIVGAERVGFAAAQVGLGARYNLFSSNFLELEVGYTAMRRYLWDDGTSTSFNIGEDPFFDRDLDPVPYFRFGILQKF